MTTQITLSTPSTKSSNTRPINRNGQITWFPDNVKGGARTKSSPACSTRP
jgi:hypothetical protein